MILISKPHRHCVIPRMLLVPGQFGSIKREEELVGSRSVSDFSLLLPLPKCPTKSLFPHPAFSDRGRGKGPRSQDGGITLRRGIQEKEGGIQDRTPTRSEGRGRNLWPLRRLQYVTIPPCGLNTELLDGAATKLSRVGFAHDYGHPYLYLTKGWQTAMYLSTARATVE